MRDKIIILLFFCTSIGFSSWYDKKLEGWYYFEENEKNLSPENTDLSTFTPKEAEEYLNKSREKLRQYLALAMIHPSQENVAKYMEMQNEWMKKNAHFAKQWATVLLTNPFLDASLENPFTSYGLEIKKTQDDFVRKSKIHELSSDHSIFFFFKGHDPYSKALSSIVKKFEQMNRWIVVPISLDRKGTNEYPNPKFDNGISKNFHISHLPALFLVNPKKELFKPVGFGLISLEQLEKNIENQGGN